MKDTADVVVIGGGAWGASSAFHLAAAGADVVLVDQHQLNSQNSPRAAGMTMQTRESDVMTLLAIRSVEKLEGFASEDGHDFNFSQSGSLKVARDEATLRTLEDQFARAERLGLEVEMVTPKRAEALAPYASFGGTLGIMYTPTDVNLDAAALTSTYVREAEQHGASLSPGNPVLGITVAGERVTAVETSQGTISCSAVVDAAGAWSPKIARMAGVDIPVVPARHQLYVTDPLAGIDDSQAGIHILDAQVYARPDRGGILFGGYESDPMMVPTDRLEDGFDMTSLDLDISTIDSMWRMVDEQLPILEDVSIRELRGGLPTLTPDGHFIIDGDSGPAGFVVATGCCVSGLARCPAVGEVVAALVTEADPFTDISPLSLQRFDEAWTEDSLAEACRAAYTHRYE